MVCVRIRVYWAHFSMKQINRSRCSLRRRQRNNHVGCTSAPHGEYGWTIYARRRCGLVSNYFDHLLCFTATLMCITIVISFHRLLCSAFFDSCNVSNSVKTWYSDCQIVNWCTGASFTSHRVDCVTLYWHYCKKLNSLKHLVRTTVAKSHN